MNVKVVNKYESLINNLDIDIIKSVSGVFTPEGLLAQFNNFFYNKMILDITAISDYENIKTMQELSVNMDMSKVILLLDDSEVVNNPKYLSALVSMGIYNFTRNIDAIKFLIDNPNSYKDVASYHQLNMVDNVSEVPETHKKSKSSNNEEEEKKEGIRIIGIKNVTEHAGSTTLTYLLKKQLEKNYKVIAVEVDNNDFVFLNDRSLKNTNHFELQKFISSNYNNDVILIDLNNEGSVDYCTDVLYLIEPGLIKLNKLIRKDPQIFDKLKGKKIVLNRSVLDNNDIEDFERESNSKVYFNIPYLDDKLDNYAELDILLRRLGFMNEDSEPDRNNKLFNIFK